MEFVQLYSAFAWLEFSIRISKHFCGDASSRKQASRVQTRYPSNLDATASPAPGKDRSLKAHRDSNMNNRKYEAMYIVRPDMADGDIEKLADRFKSVVEEKGGTVESAGKWEKRKLAYELAGLKEGNYIQMNFESGPAVPQELNRLLGIHDDVIRHRIFKIDE